MEYFDELLQTLILTKSSPSDCQILFTIGRGFPEFQIVTKWNWPYILFGIGRGFAEFQIVTKWNWPYIFSFVQNSKKIKTVLFL